MVGDNSRSLKPRVIIEHSSAPCVVLALLTAGAEPITQHQLVVVRFVSMHELHAVPTWLSKQPVKHSKNQAAMLLSSLAFLQHQIANH